MTACSRVSLSLDEPLAGTAPEATSWIVVEQPGPWGRKALTQSHLDPVLGAALETAAHAHGARVALVRRPGRHPDTGRRRPRRVWVASARPGMTWLLGGEVDDVEALGALAWSGLESGDQELVRASIHGLKPETEPLLLVCTNGRRDVCCANYGRPLALAMHGRLPDRVWETTHLGGHRFAPTAVVLPFGVAHGRLDVDGAVQLVEQARAGRHVGIGYRGRSTFSRPGQAAEAAVRDGAGVDGFDDLDVATVEQRAASSWRVVVAHRDGRRWSVDVRARPLDPPRPESCGAAAVQPLAYVVDMPTMQE
ncbi:MAG: sucrase ferredoxin [Jiangellaceae bacterium]